jgi:large subunit ribosomal protein L24
MIKSGQPRKQRKFRFNAPMHSRQKFLNVHISKGLKTKLNVKKRTLQIKTGDYIEVMKGKFKGKTGKVSKVSLRTNKILIEGISRKTSKGKEVMIPIYSSNVYITDIDATDKFRKEKLGIK